MTNITEPTPAEQRFEKLLAQWRTLYREMAKTDVEEEINAISDQMQIVESAIYDAPATSVFVVLGKLEVASYDQRDTYPDVSKRLVKDLRRLTDTPTSPLFDAETWLIEWEQVGGCYLVRDEQVFICATPDNSRQRRQLATLDEMGGRDAVTKAIKANNRTMREVVA